MAFPSDRTEIRRLVETSRGRGIKLGKFELSGGMKEIIERGQIPKPETVNDAVKLICFIAERQAPRGYH